MTQIKRDPREKRADAYYENGELKFKGDERKDAPEPSPLPAEPSSTPAPSKYFADTPNSRKGRDFAIGDVLQVVTGRNLATDLYESVFALLSYMCGVRVDNVTYPEALEVCRQAICEQYPDLARFAPNGAEYEWESPEAELWMAKRYRELGETLRIAKLDIEEAEKLHEEIERKLTRLNPPSKKREREVNYRI